MGAGVIFGKLTFPSKGSVLMRDSSHRTQCGRKPPSQRLIRLSEQHHNVGVCGKLWLHAVWQRENVTLHERVHLRTGQSDDQVLKTDFIERSGKSTKLHCGHVSIRMAWQAHFP